MKCEHCYQHDGLDSTIALTNDQGQVTESYQYDVFGKASIFDASGTPISHSAFAIRHLFTGREWLAELGLYDYRNRIYSAELGRFLQTDPIRFNAGDVNVYRYCGNRVTVATDPSGKACIMLGTDECGNPIYDCFPTPPGPTPDPGPRVRPPGHNPTKNRVNSFVGGQLNAIGNYALAGVYGTTGVALGVLESMGAAQLDDALMNGAEVLANQPDSRLYPLVAPMQGLGLAIGLAGSAASDGGFNSNTYGNMSQSHYNTGLQQQQKAWSSP